MASNNHTPTDEVVRTGLQTLIANSIAIRAADGSVEEDWDRTIEYQRHITSDLFPWDMQFEARMMELIYQHSINNIPPTPESLRLGMTTQFGMDGSQIDQRMADIIAKRTIDRDVSGISYWMWQAICLINADAALEEAQGILRSPWGTIEDRKAEALTRVTESFDFEDDLTDFTIGEMLDDRLRTMYDTWELVSKGGVPGPSLKWRGFTHVRDDKGNIRIPGKIPFLRWGNTTLITAKPGYGKTTIGTQLAEYNAWILGLDVLYIHLETPAATLSDRIYARNLLIPAGYLASGNINTKDRGNPTVQQLAQFASYAASPVKGINGREYKSGTIRYKHAVGWDVYRIVNVIADQRRKSAAAGRGLLVIVDYYNLITPRTTGNVADQLGQIALTLRNSIMRENAKMPRGTGVHCLVFAQESAGSGDPYPYGSKQIVQYSQIHISIEREEAKVRREFPGVADKTVVNFMGRPRVLHEAGGYDCVTRMKILKANDDERGVVEVIIENNLFRVYDSDGNGGLIADYLY